MAEKKSISIEKEKDSPVALDFKSLRQHGIDLIQKLSGHVWTDYNLHDPGVTILEMLCFAITDLAYRTDFPIQDLLTDEHGNIPLAENSFFPKEEILTTNPITVNDFRRVIRDEIDDVYNVWLEPVTSKYSAGNIKGLYRIFVQMTKEAVQGNEERGTVEERVKDQVRKSFVSKRNLCEDWVRDVIILAPMEINISADVIVTENAIPEDVLARIYTGLENYLNPPVKYYSEEELLNAGVNIEDIYACTLLKKGFIPSERVNPRRLVIDPDEIVKDIMQEEGVINVKNLIIRTPDGNTLSGPYKLDELKFPYLVNDIKDPLIRIIKGKNKALIEEALFRDLLMKVQEISKRTFISSFRVSGEVLKGSYRDIAQYYSIQDHFPLIYGIGKQGPPTGATDELKAQARQLKSYLLLFEQVLANYLSQLAHVKDLFSDVLTGAGSFTYYSQPLYGVPHVKNLLKAFTKTSEGRTDEEWELFKRDEHNEYVEALGRIQETDHIYRERKNKVFDHLLARFNIVLDTYPVKLFNLLYGSLTDDERADEMLKWKADILSNMVELSHDRTKAIDYLAAPGDIQTFTGFQKRLAKLLYIQNMKRRPLSWVFDLKDAPPGGIRNVRSLVQRSKNKSTSGETASNGERPGESYDFGSQTTDIFKYGIDINNYKIVQDTGKSGDYRIVFKSPEEKAGIHIGRTYKDNFSAIASLERLTSYLKQVNVESEGFHLVEHVLLRPALKSQSFGFGFYEDVNTLLFSNRKWSSFKEREDMLREISLSGINPKDASQLLEKIQIPGDKKESLDNILKNIRLRQDRKTRFYPRFELWTRLPDGSVMNGEYFNFRMSVVFPSWPARFQDDSFRIFAEDLFRINAPAHIRINFFWMNLFEMKEFEKIYFEWLNSLKKPENGVADIHLSEKLISLLKGDIYRVKELG